MHIPIVLLVGALLSFVTVPLDTSAQDVRQPFSQWLGDVRAEALARGIRPEIVEEALAGIEEPLATTIERDRAQPETVLPLEAYIARSVRQASVRRGQQMLRRHRALLNRVSDTYGVPSSVLVAVWGVESNFGRYTGAEPTVAALVTLAWDQRRANYFRQELFSALEILNRGDIEAARMRGSWAGAMGQPQLMPTSYLEYAVDFDGDGRRDIWDSPGDIFASIANYLKQHGWATGQRWGREVIVPRGGAMAVAQREGSCRATREMTVGLPLQQWRRLGVRLPGRRPLPKADFPAYLVSGSRRRFLVYDNYDVLLAYNCAHSYALSVGLLADRIGR